MKTIRVDRRFFSDDLTSAADQMIPLAHQKLQSLISGSCPGAEWTGWVDYPRRRGFDLAREIIDFRAKLELHYDTVVVIGIGGSYLGTRAVADALSHEYGAALRSRPGSAKRPTVIYAGHHLSELGLLELLDFLEQRQPIVNVISKSGTTTEPSVAFRVLKQYMEGRFGGESARRIIATTDPTKGALRRLAVEQGYATFEVPADIGGRFSVLSAVGLLPLALAGFDVTALLEGADGTFREVLTTDLEIAATNPALVYAASRMAAYQAGHRIEVLSHSEPKLRSVVEWWKQLFGESEGKQGRGIFPAGMSYTTDLHSLGQYVQDGHRHLIETFLNCEDVRSVQDVGVERHLRVPQSGDGADELGYLEGRLIGEINGAAMKATKVAHFDGGVPCLELAVARLDERSLGSLFAFFETACAVSGLLLGVNPFDQPGVEDYKRNLFGLMGKPGFEEIGTELRRRL